MLFHSEWSRIDTTLTPTQPLRLLSTLGLSVPLSVDPRLLVQPPWSPHSTPPWIRSLINTESAPQLNITLKDLRAASSLHPRSQTEHTLRTLCPMVDSIDNKPSICSVGTGMYHVASGIL